MEEYYISTDKAKLNVDLIHSFLSRESYWAKGRSIEVVRKSIEHSICFGVFQGDRQLGFARVVTDYSVFAWIMDVFILNDYRKKGLGKLLLEAIMNHNELQNLQRWGLATDDAHGLYKQYGFRVIVKADTFMEIVSRPS